MSTEELMMPRYKVINIWPDMGNYGNYQGQVITMVKLNNGEIGWPTFKVTFYPAHFENYPHLFKKLEWWEERAIEDMPEYLNCPSRKKFFKVESWHKSYFIIDGRQKMQYRNYIPATLAEYEQYNQQKQTNE